MRKINVLGICLTDYTLKESLKIADQYMKSGAGNTIAYLSSKLLIAADGNEEWKAWIEAVDMTLCTEADVLCTEEGLPKSRIREIEENMFLVEFLRKAAKEKRKIYLLVNTREKLAALQEELLQLQDNLQITGGAVLELTDSADTFINEANDLAPDIIISELPSPRQEQIMYENRKKINAKIWLALLEGSTVCARHQNIGERLMRYIYIKIFRKRVEQYHNNDLK